MEPWKILIPQVHLKLGLIKHFITDKESSVFKFLQGSFTKLSAAKVKVSVFVRPEMKKIIDF